MIKTMSFQTTATILAGSFAGGTGLINLFSQVRTKIEVFKIFGSIVSLDSGTGGYVNSFSTFTIINNSSSTPFVSNPASSLGSSASNSFRYSFIDNFYADTHFVISPNDVFGITLTCYLNSAATNNVNNSFGILMSYKLID